MKELLAQIIAAEGPLPVDRYMALCLGHPRLGYYMSRDPFGAAGDFTTAPEISQIFGELIGIWCVAAWEAIGSPAPFALVELGPGRGTLMADLLRATARAPEFRAALQVHLVEMSPVLRKIQQDKLGDRLRWHDTIETLPDEPLIFIANEFYDALPIRQIEKRGAKYFERCVVMRGGELVLSEVPAPAFDFSDDGLHEISPISGIVAEGLGARIAALGGAGLVIDYGHFESGIGDTLQALKAHEVCDVLKYPGTSDLTAHVDFAQLAQAFKAGGAEVLPAITQGQFLTAMGHEARAAKLAGQLSGETLSAFSAGARRLVDDKAMGKLFKVLAVAQQNRAALYPFET